MLKIDFGGPYPVYLYIYIEYDNTMHGNTGMLNKFFSFFFLLFLFEEYLVNFQRLPLMLSFDTLLTHTRSRNCP